MKLFLTVLILFIQFIGFTQLKSKAFSIDANLGFGALVPHKLATNHLKQGPSFIGEIGVSYRTEGEKFYEGSYRFPVIGITYAYNSTGNSHDIGFAQAIYAHISFPFSKKHNALMLKVGTGLGYVQKTFTKFTNTNNNAIGSHLNVNAQLRIEKKFKIAEHQLVSLGTGFSHFSNASYSKPNLGINFCHLYLGYSFQKREFDYLKYDTLAQIALLRYSPWDLNISGGFGVKEVSLPLGPKYGIFSASILLDRQFNFVSSLAGGIDFFGNYALKKEQNKFFQSGVTAGYFLNFNKFKAGFALGLYLYNAPKEFKYIYNKLILEYWFKNHFYTQLSLKSHGATADFFSVSFGYKIW